MKGRQNPIKSNCDVKLKHHLEPKIGFSAPVFYVLKKCIITGDLYIWYQFSIIGHYYYNRRLTYNKLDPANFTPIWGLLV